MIEVKYNTDDQVITLGQFRDALDGDTEETNLNLQTTDIWLIKNGDTTVTNKDSSGATHIQNGIYHITLTSNDTDTYGPMQLYIHKSGSLAMAKTINVMNTDAYQNRYGISTTQTTVWVDIDKNTDTWIDIDRNI